MRTGIWPERRSKTAANETEEAKPLRSSRHRVSATHRRAWSGRGSNLRRRRPHHPEAHLPEPRRHHTISGAARAARGTGAPAMYRSVRHSLQP